MTLEKLIKGAVSSIVLLALSCGSIPPKVDSFEVLNIEKNKPYLQGMVRTGREALYSAKVTGEDLAGCIYEFSDGTKSDVVFDCKFKYATKVDGEYTVTVTGVDNSGNKGIPLENKNRSVKNIPPISDFDIYECPEGLVSGLCQNQKKLEPTIVNGKRVYTAKKYDALRNLPQYCTDLFKAEDEDGELKDYYWDNFRLIHFGIGELETGDHGLTFCFGYNAVEVKHESISVEDAEGLFGDLHYDVNVTD